MLQLTAFFLIALAPVYHVSAQTSRTDVNNPSTAFSEDSRFAGLTLTTQSGLVILRGTVESCKDKRDALKQVSSIEGVKEVEDHVEVKTKQIADRSLSREIDQNLKDPNFRALRFRVSKGVVTLRGRVASDSDRQQVVGLVCGIAGVIDVDDQRVRVLAHTPDK
jgi:BON domain-containing protein